jgi:penicillin-binding protein 2
VVDAARRVRPWESADVRLSRRTLPRTLRSNGDAHIHVKGVFDHVLGTIREETWAEDLARRPFLKADGTVDPGGYRPGPDLVGGRGLEAAYEDWLRGTRGQLRTRLDTDQSERVEPVFGRPLKLTVDIELQARVQAILNPQFGLTRVQDWHGGEEGLPIGAPLASAAVIVEVESGDIMALGSWPTLADAADLSPSDQFRLQPGVNRASEGVYPPGSIVKPLVYVGAVGAGKFAAGGTVECTGHYFPEFTDRARCWIYRPQFGMTTHTAQTGGPLPVESAIGRSCNIFFYTVAHRFGLRPLVEWYRALGVGSTLGTGLQGPLPADQRKGGGENAGIVPGEDQLAAIEARRDQFTPIIMGIGQGPIAWTPLQAANAYATFARGGELRDARIVADADALPPDRRSGRLDMPADACRRALEGLRQSVEERFGTGHHIKYDDGSQEAIFAIPGVTVRGKTGTAQAPPLAIDDDGDGRADRTIKGVDHAWFVGLAGEKGAKPKYAIAVLVDRGGSGGKAAGPIAAQIVMALIDEGYLGDEHGDHGAGEPAPLSPSNEPQPMDPEDREG